MGLPARHPDNVVSLTEPDVLSFHFVLQDCVNTAVLNFATLRVFDVQGPNETLKKSFRIQSKNCKWVWPKIPCLVDDLDGLWELSVERGVLEKGPLVDVPEWTVFQRILAVVNCHRTLLWDACQVQKVCNHPKN